MIPYVPVRQWVLSLPWELRFRLIADPDLCRAVASAFLDAVFAFRVPAAKAAGPDPPLGDGRRLQDGALPRSLHPAMLSPVFVLAVAASVLTSAPQGAGRYRAQFERGVEALRAGDTKAAAEAFCIAGALAPAAPVWPAYLAEATRAASALPVQQAGVVGPWRLVPDSRTYGPRFAPGGEWLLAGDARSLTLWDLAHGTLVTTVEATAARNERVRFQPERSGKYLCQVSSVRTDAEWLQSIDVRRPSTGEVVGPALRLGRRVADGTVFEWSERPPAAAPALEEGPWFLVQRRELDGGTFTAFQPRFDPTRPDLHARLAPDARRALLTHRDRSGLVVTRLVSLDDPVPLATLLTDGHGEFSRNGEIVLAGGWSGALKLVDATTGAGLATPPEAELVRWSECAPRIQIVTSGHELAVATTDLVRWFDPRSGTWAREVALSPALDDLPWKQERLRCSVFDAARAVVFSSHACIAVYDAHNGARLWWRRIDSGHLEGDAFESPTRTLLTFTAGGGAPSVVDARTGESAVALDRGSVGAQAVVPFAFHGEDEDAAVEAALVVADDGTLRTFALADGRSLARAALHKGSTVALLGVGFVPGEAGPVAALTCDDGGRVVLSSLPSLTPRATMALEHSATVVAASLVTGTLVTSRPDAASVLVEIRQIQGEDGAVVARFEVPTLRTACTSSDGRFYALVGEETVQIRDAADGALCTLLVPVRPPLGTYDGAVAFHGERLLAMGWGSSDFLSAVPGVGLDVYDLTTGELAGRHQATGTDVGMYGGWVEDIESMPDVNRLAYTLSAGSSVVLLDDSDWSALHAQSLGGDTQAAAPLSRAPGSRRILASRTPGGAARVLHVESMDRIPADAVRELSDLHESPSGRFVVGLHAGRVHVVATEGFSTLYERQELTGPGTRIVTVDAQVRDGDTDASAVRDVHITRGELSYPLGCFDAWLLDPLGLAYTSLAQLPDPPRIAAGPARIVRSGGERLKVTFRAEDADGLLGVWVLASGRVPEFVSSGGSAGAPVFRADLGVDVAGPWPIELKLVAVDRFGIESLPWHVRIESGE